MLALIPDALWPHGRKNASNQSGGTWARLPLLLRMFLFGLLAVAALMFVDGLLAVASHASANSASGDAVPSTEGTVYTFDAMLWTFATGTIIPLIINFATKATSTGLRVVFGLVFSVIGAVVQTAYVLDGVAIVSKATATIAALTAITNWLVNKNLIQPTGIAGALSPGKGL